MNEMRRYLSIKTRYMINCQTMIKRLGKFCWKLNPARYPLNETVDEIRRKTCTCFSIIAKICKYKKGGRGGGVNHLHNYYAKTINDMTGCWHLRKLSPK